MRKLPVKYILKVENLIADQLLVLADIWYPISVICGKSVPIPCQCNTSWYMDWKWRVCTPFGFSPDYLLEMLDLLPVTSQVYTKPVSPEKCPWTAFVAPTFNLLFMVSRFGTCILEFSYHFHGYGMETQTGSVTVYCIYSKCISFPCSERQFAVPKEQTTSLQVT